MERNSRSVAYCDRVQLGSLQDSAMAYELKIEDEMLLWTVDEAKAFFDSKGAVRPDPNVVATRSPNDAPPKVSKIGPKLAVRDCWLAFCCPCDGGLVSMIMEKHDKRNEEKARAARPPGHQPAYDESVWSGEVALSTLAMVGLAG
eukprot:7190100-Prymnesium_polylepis.1